MSVEFSPHGVDLFGDPIQVRSTGPVGEQFLFPPFSVLDARQGEWQERKRAWCSMGISGEIGRSAPVIHCPTESAADGMADAEYTSIFDPVVCELAYRWFCPVRGQVVDPFAGGSVRGIVAKALGRRYWGCDLRAEQVRANVVQAEQIFQGYDGLSETLPGIEPIDLQWVCGDSMDEMEKAPAADLVFSCPPYGDLERYSDDPRDLSVMEWHTFAAAYRRIILRAAKLMKPDSFACFVVGDFRDNRGHYRNFIGETVSAFAECGLALYNEAVLVTPVGSASMRVTKQFISGRKFAKTHQNFLVFVKGDWRKAATACNRA